MNNKTSFHIRPIWLTATAGCVCMAGFLYLFLAKNEDDILHRIECICGLLVCVCIIVISGRGFILDANYFTITWFGIVLDKIAWDDISQVVVLKRKVPPRANCLFTQDRVIYVTIKPADQFPVYARPMLSYRLSNLFLVWRIYLYHALPSVESELLDTFERFFGEITRINHT